MRVVPAIGIAGIANLVYISAVKLWHCFWGLFPNTLLCWGVGTKLFLANRSLGKLWIVSW